MPELEGFLLHPVRIPIERKRTRRRLLSSRHVSVPFILTRELRGRAYSGAGMQIRGAASLADVPYWRKPKYRLTSHILPRMGLFLKPDQA